MNIEEIINECGGYATVARELNLSGRQVVYNWCLRDAIPFKHLRAMLEVGLIREDEYDQLVKNRALQS